MGAQTACEQGMGLRSGLTYVISGQIKKTVQSRAPTENYSLDSDFIIVFYYLLAGTAAPAPPVPVVIAQILYLLRSGHQPRRPVRACLACAA